MQPFVNTLHAYGVIGEKMLKDAVRPLSATRETEDSIRYEVVSEETKDTLFLLARAYFETLETGRGPRKSSQLGNFTDKMLEYIKARGIGADLDDKKRRQLARFLTWRINKEGDRTFKQGGRKVYSEQLEDFVVELIEALRKDFVSLFRATLKSAFHGPVNS